MIRTLLEGLHRYFGRLTGRPHDLEAAMLYLLSVEALNVEDNQLPVIHALMDRSIARWYENGEERLVCFISPAVLRIAISVLCVAPRPEKEVTTLPEFLTQVLSKIRSDFL